VDDFGHPLDHGVVWDLCHASWTIPMKGERGSHQASESMDSSPTMLAGEFDRALNLDHIRLCRALFRNLGKYAHLLIILLRHLDLCSQFPDLAGVRRRSSSSAAVLR
jgi:hypothetical protein